MIEVTIVRTNKAEAFDYSLRETNGALHILDLIVVVAIALLLVGPKTVQSLSRKAGKGVGQAKTMKDQVMAELPMEEISDITNTFSKIPRKLNRLCRSFCYQSRKINSQKQKKKLQKRVPHPRQPRLSDLLNSLIYSSM